MWAEGAARLTWGLRLVTNQSTMTSKGMDAVRSTKNHVLHVRARVCSSLV